MDATGNDQWHSQELRQKDGVEDAVAGDAAMVAGRRWMVVTNPFLNSGEKITKKQHRGALAMSMNKSPTVKFIQGNH
mgnify:CR=1 FL=1